MNWIAEGIDPSLVQTQTFYWSAVILAVAVAGFGLIWIFKHFWKKSEGQAHEAGFSLSDLRAMRDRGEITPEEYEQTRANVIAKVKKKAEEKPRPKRGAEDQPTDLKE